MKKIIGLCLSICLLLSFNISTPIRKVYSDVATSDEIHTSESVSSFLSSYMSARNTLLTTGSSSLLEEIAVVGILNDEITHRNSLIDKGIIIVDSSFEIIDLTFADTEITVTLLESVWYSDISSNTETINHNIKIYFTEENQLIVVSDGYYETHSNFKSASYVDISVETNFLSSIPTRSTSSSNILSIAKSQVGYKEKKSNEDLDSFDGNAGSNNYTKYGAWYPLNGQPWCAIFVSWCANQAGIPTSIIPKFSSCTTGMNTFKNNGRFHYSPAYSTTSYTPQVGDIFFTGSSSSVSLHTGIVVAVSASTITVVDGNCSDQVSQHTYSRTDTSLIGYGNPNYCPNGHSYSYVSSSVYHWKECGVCGKTTEKEEHSWVLKASYYQCITCKRTATSIPSISSISCLEFDRKEQV